MSTSSVPALRLRPATPDDSEFAFQTKKAAFREYAEQVWGWDEAEQRQLHEQRFAAQDFLVLERAGTDVGVLAMVRTAEGHHLKQLFILPQHQGAGIGSACMAQVMEEARRDRAPIRLQVLKVNPAAVRFYERLGFHDVGETATHRQLVWAPSRRRGSTAQARSL